MFSVVAVMYVVYVDFWIGWCWILCNDVDLWAW